MLRTMKCHLPVPSLILIFNATVCSILEYCSPLLIGLTRENAERLERVQKWFHRTSCGSDYKECVSHCFEALSSRRKRAVVKLFKQAMSDSHILHPYMPSASTTGHIVMPYASYTRRLNSFFVKVSILINEDFKR